MCVLLWSMDNHPNYKFVFAGNRDEFLARPTALASWWQPDVLSGRDLLRIDRGTWLGVTREGRFAAVTNYRELPPANANELLSRGCIVKNILLATDKSIESCVRDLGSRAHEYGGFNLLASDLSTPAADSVYFGNRQNVKMQRLAPKAIYGLSNTVLAEPWSKVREGQARMANILAEAQTEDQLIKDLFALLSTVTPWKSGATFKEYVETTVCIPKYGEGSQAYGTRTSTVMLVTHLNEVVFVEQTLYDEQGQRYASEKLGERQFKFRIGDYAAAAAAAAAIEEQANAPEQGS